MYLLYSSKNSFLAVSHFNLFPFLLSGINNLLLLCFSLFSSYATFISYNTHFYYDLTSFLFTQPTDNVGVILHSQLLHFFILVTIHRCWKSYAVSYSAHLSGRMFSFLRDKLVLLAAQQELISFNFPIFFCEKNSLSNIFFLAFTKANPHLIDIFQGFLRISLYCEQKATYQYPHSRYPNANAL